MPTLQFDSSIRSLTPEERQQVLETAKRLTAENVATLVEIFVEGTALADVPHRSTGQEPADLRRAAFYGAPQVVEYAVRTFESILKEQIELIAEQIELIAEQDRLERARQRHGKRDA